MIEKKKPPMAPGQICEVEIVDLNHRGEGVGKKEGFALFVPRALPGEIARVKVKSVHKKYAEADLLDVAGASPDRVEPPCAHYPACGGCRLLHLSYEKQLAWKQKLVKETLRRIAGINPEIKPALGMKDPRHYRNKAEIHLECTGGRVKAGFFEPYSRRVVNINSCLVQHPSNNVLLNAVRTAAQEYIEQVSAEPGSCSLPISRVIIRSSLVSGESLLAITGSKLTGCNQQSKAAGWLQMLSDMFCAHAPASLTGLVYLPEGRENDKQIILSGRSYIEESIEPFTFRVSARSFFQVNTSQAKVLYKQALALAGSPRTAFDLYCGTGNFALYLAEKAERVIGIDSDISAIKDARHNASLNGAFNIEFVEGRAEERPDLFAKGDLPKTAFLNPPRAGCSPSLLKAISRAGLKKLVYISCNPATLARDLKILEQAGYRIKEVRPVDMFPHASHVECLVSIEKL